MTSHPSADSEYEALLAHVDPWVVLQDGRRQLLAALEGCDARSGTRMLTIPEFANLGATAGAVSTMLLAHAARDRAHAAFFASLDATAAESASIDAVHVADDDWASVRAEVDAARLAMLEAVAALSSDRWEQPILPPWEGASAEPLISLLLVRAMSDGILADAIMTLLASAPEP